MTLSVNAYVDVANTLREVYILDPSQRENGFTAERKGDVLRQLRKQFENARKMFTFSIANASKILHLSICISLTIFSRSRTGCRCKSYRSRQLFHECRRKEKVWRSRSSQESQLWESEPKQQRWHQLQERFSQRGAAEDPKSQRKPRRQVQLLQLSENRSFRQKLPRTQENRAYRVNRYSNHVKLPSKCVMSNHKQQYLISLFYYHVFNEIVLHFFFCCNAINRYHGSKFPHFRNTLGKNSIEIHIAIQYSKFHLFNPRDIN